MIYCLIGLGKVLAIKMKTKSQFNTRVDSDLKRATKTLAGALNWTIEEITEVALASAFGARDELVQAKRKKLEQESRRLNLSFDDADGQSVSVAIA